MLKNDKGQKPYKIFTHVDSLRDSPLAPNNSMWMNAQRGVLCDGNVHIHTLGGVCRKPGHAIHFPLCLYWSTTHHLLSFVSSLCLMIDGLFQNKPERGAVASQLSKQDARHKIFNINLSMLEKSLTLSAICARKFNHI